MIEPTRSGSAMRRRVTRAQLRALLCIWAQGSAPSASSVTYARLSRAGLIQYSKDGAGPGQGAYEPTERGRYVLFAAGLLTMSGYRAS